MPEKQNLGIIFWEGHLDISPSIVNLVKLLIKNDFYITCYLRENEHSKAIDFEGEDCLQIVEFPNDSSLKNALNISAPKNELKRESEIKSNSGFVKRIRNKNRKLIKYLKFVLYGYSVFKRKKYKYFFCVDARSLVFGYIIKVFLNSKIKIIYYSLEIRTETEMNSKIDILIKKAERIVNKKATLTITQDYYRLKYLGQINKMAFNSNNSAIIPNGIIGYREITSNGYFKKHFKLASSDILLLSAGGFALENMVREIASSASTWSVHLKLIFHVTSKFVRNGVLFKEVMENSCGKAIISDELFTIKDLAEVVKSAHIGLALYDKSYGGNMLNIVGASGKMILYLHCGVPVIAFRSFPGFTELFDKYQIGILIDSVFEIEDAAQQIMKNYEYYSSNCVRCFNEEFEFEKSFNRMFEKLQENL